MCIHWLLRVPTGISNAEDVKANVLFFDMEEASDYPWTEKLRDEILDDAALPQEPYVIAADLVREPSAWRTFSS